jgi:hypothetical protein
MLRTTVAALGLTIALYSTSAHAHGEHADCRDGWTSAHGTTPHYHDRGGRGSAVPCGGRGRYQPRDYYEDDDEPGYDRPAPRYYGPPAGYYQRGGNTCEWYRGRRICCPQGHTIQDGVCKPYRGR